MRYFFRLNLQWLKQVIVGVCGAVWFGFEGKSHPNGKIKKHAVWFGPVDFKNNIQTKPN